MSSGTLETMYWSIPPPAICAARVFVIELFKADCMNWPNMCGRANEKVLTYYCYCVRSIWLGNVIFYSLKYLSDSLQVRRRHTETKNTTNWVEQWTVNPEQWVKVRVFGWNKSISLGERTFSNWKFICCLICLIFFEEKSNIRTNFNAYMPSVADVYGQPEIKAYVGHELSMHICNVC